MKNVRDEQARPVFLIPFASNKSLIYSHCTNVNFCFNRRTREFQKSEKIGPGVDTKGIHEFDILNTM